ncbi:DUF6958 family protein [Edaphobacillus lindanitolerans]|uniref:Uncharacterized protein n=1 Tax=Edaphobacillus lindanitolerans TaxID=550447 RepID=A0A1U7PLY9_9BACI|nr:hypothetical protein [Edaphobacillus lindanitolerans]SIT70157.1 hypothetical protein SAMN05428946_0575 [Edaphobacillus lindanitolerans]
MGKRDEEQIQLLHPKGETAGKILTRRYEAIRKAILEEVDANGEISFTDLTERAPKRISHFDGKTTWYITAVKLDLEARGELERFEREGEQWLRRPNK